MLFEVIACERNGPRVADAGADVLIGCLNDGFGGLFYVRAPFNWTAPYKRRRLSTLGLCALREAHMERFVHNEYLIHLRKQLAGATDEAKRRQTSPLPCDEEVKDHLPPKEK